MRVPIETGFGSCADATVCFWTGSPSKGTATVVLEGEVNGALMTTAKDVYISYVLRFRGVLALQMIELDSWTEQSVSSFDEVRNSTWVADLGGKVTNRHRHFSVQTYDDVFDIVCEGYELMFGPEGSRGGR